MLAIVLSLAFACARALSRSRSVSLSLAFAPALVIARPLSHARIFADPLALSLAFSLALSIACARGLARSRSIDMFRSLGIALLPPPFFHRSDAVAAFSHMDNLISSSYDIPPRPRTARQYEPGSRPMRALRFDNGCPSRRTWLRSVLMKGKS